MSSDNEFFPSLVEQGGHLGHHAVGQGQELERMNRRFYVPCSICILHALHSVAPAASAGRAGRDQAPAGAQLSR